jgi:hypothetical protein
MSSFGLKPAFDRLSCLTAEAVRFARAGYRRILDAFSSKALTNVKRGTFREFQLYMVRWQTKHLA